MPLVPLQITDATYIPSTYSVLLLLLVAPLFPTPAAVGGPGLGILLLLTDLGLTGGGGPFLPVDGDDLLSAGGVTEMFTTGTGLTPDAGLLLAGEICRTSGSCWLGTGVVVTELSTPFSSDTLAFWLLWMMVLSSNANLLALYFRSCIDG